MGEPTRTPRQVDPVADRYPLQRRLERLDYLPQVERVCVRDGEMPPAVLAEPEVDAVCALLARVSLRLLHGASTRGGRLRLVK